MKISLALPRSAALRVLLRVAAATSLAAAGASVGCSSDEPTPPPVDAGVTTVTVEPATATINVNGTQQFSAKLLVPKAAPRALLANEVTWATSAPSVATIDRLTGLATAVGAGTATLTVSTKSDGGTYSGTATLTVVAPHVLKSITVEPATKTINVGETVTYKAKGQYLDKTEEDIASGGVWKTSDLTVASINATTGVAVGGKAGQVSVTVVVGSTTSAPATLTVLAVDGGVDAGHDGGSDASGDASGDASADGGPDAADATGD